MKLSAVVAGAIAIALGGCSLLLGPGSSREQVIGQATPDGEIAYDVVKVDEAVVATLRAQAEPPFHERFKKYLPSPDLRIAVGDVVSVVVWEAAGNGLFGNSLDLVSVRVGGVARSLLGSPGGGVQNGGLLSSSPSAGAPAGLGALDPSMAAALAGAGIGTGAAGFSTSGSLGGGLGSGIAAAAAAAGATGGAVPLTSNADPARNAALAAAAGRPRTPAEMQELEQQLAASGRPGTRIPPQEVGSDGAITIPYAGRLPVAERTPAEVQHDIETRLADKALSPQVLVIVQRSPANSVSVAGEVVKGGRIILNPGGERLLEVIAAAGGATAPVHDTFVRLSRDGVTATVPLALLVANPQEDIFAQPGDVLTLVRRQQTFTVFGAASQNRTITFNRDRLMLSEALAKSGGLIDELADPRAVFLFRYEPQPVVRALGQPIATRAPDGVSPVAYRFDLMDPKTYLLAQQFPVRDRDVIFAADAAAMPIYKFFGGLAKISGPVVTGFVVCQSTKC